MEFLLLSRRRSSSRKVPSGEERGEWKVFAGYHKLGSIYFEKRNCPFSGSGYLPFIWGNGNSGWKIKWFVPFRLGSLRKYGLWFEGDITFPLFFVCSADLDVFCSGLFSHHVKFYSFMFMQKVYTRMVCVNGKNPQSCCVILHYEAVLGMLRRRGFPSARLNQRRCHYFYDGFVVAEKNHETLDVLPFCDRREPNPLQWK